MEKARGNAGFWRGIVITLAVFALTVAILSLGAAQVDSRSEAEQAQALEDSVRRAVILCYAVEGRYPDTPQELRENYGLSYNENRYMVVLDSFAANLLPDIRILTIGGEPLE